MLLGALPLVDAQAQDTVATPTTAATKTRVRPRFAIGVSSGVTRYALGESGSTSVSSLRFELDATKWLVVDGSLGFFQPFERIRSVFAPDGVRERTTYVVRESQAQFQLPGPVVRPYVGVGLGSMIGGPDVEERFTATAGTGVRVWVRPTALDVRAEVRARYIGGMAAGSATEWMLGAGVRF
jgi:hypothetical protein